MITVDATALERLEVPHTEIGVGAASDKYGHFVAASGKEYVRVSTNSCVDGWVNGCMGKWSSEMGIIILGSPVRAASDNAAVSVVRRSKALQARSHLTSDVDATLGTCGYQALRLIAKDH